MTIIGHVYASHPATRFMLEKAVRSDVLLRYQSALPSVPLTMAVTTGGVGSETVTRSESLAASSTPSTNIRPIRASHVAADGVSS